MLCFWLGLAHHSLKIGVAAAATAAAATAAVDVNSDADIAIDTMRFMQLGSRSWLMANGARHRHRHRVGAIIVLAQHRLGHRRLGPSAGAGTGAGCHGVPRLPQRKHTS